MRPCSPTAPHSPRLRTPVTSSPEFPYRTTSSPSMPGAATCPLVTSLQGLSHLPPSLSRRLPAAASALVRQQQRRRSFWCSYRSDFPFLPFLSLALLSSLCSGDDRCSLLCANGDLLVRHTDCDEDDNNIRRCLFSFSSSWGKRHHSVLPGTKRQRHLLMAHHLCRGSWRPLPVPDLPHLPCLLNVDHVGCACPFLSRNICR